MNWGSAHWRVLFSKRSAKIFLYAWFFATLGLVLAIGAATVVVSILIDGLALGVFVVLYWFLCPIPALLVAVCVLISYLFCADISRSENIVLAICTVAFGVVADLPADANVVVMAFWPLSGFLSAVVALIMTKNLRLASYADEPSR